MAERNRATSTAGDESGRFTNEERAAMKERARELKTSRRPRAQADGEADVRDKITTMAKSDRTIAERLHAIIKEHYPELSPRTWYGMPAYAKDGNLVCFFQDSQKFKTRYATLGFSDKARLDDGTMWPVTYALMHLTGVEEKRIVALLKKALS
jgi:uncharacterized protein YdhG (YjbR/CyaY superfamily)